MTLDRGIKSQFDLGLTGRLRITLESLLNCNQITTSNGESERGEAELHEIVRAKTHLDL